MLRKITHKLIQRLPMMREMREVRSLLEYLDRKITGTQAILFEAQCLSQPRYMDPLRLLRHHHQVCSQNGEDGIIHEIFRRIGTTNRIFAEVGVGDGKENNTAFLLSQGWTGFWFDGGNAFVPFLESRKDLQGGCLKYHIGFVTRENIAGLFDQMSVPKEIDFLSLDIDQNTYYAWEGLRTLRPRAVVVEFNAALPPGVDWKARYAPDRVWDGTQNFGASLKAFENLARELGYSLVGCEQVGMNAFFVRDDLVAGKFAEPFTAENHYEPIRYLLNHRRSHPPSILDRENPK